MSTFNLLWLIPLIVLGFLIVFPLFWCFVVWIISVAGGWSRLAERFRSDERVVGRTWNWQTIGVGWANYRNMMTLTATPTGLFMQPMWAFRFAHPPLFIPWHEMHNAEEHTFLVRQIRAEIGLPTITSIRLPAAIVEEYDSLQI